VVANNVQRRPGRAVCTEQGTWVPTHRAVWIRAQELHCIAISGVVAIGTLHLSSNLAFKTLRTGCCVLNIPPLLKELILETCAKKMPKKSAGHQRHLVQVILDLLKTIQIIPPELPNPADLRARRFAELLLVDSSDRTPVAQLHKRGGAGKRTMERLFRPEKV
jgi:hypothetical protein